MDLNIFWAAHLELRETSDLNIEDAGMHHAIMVHDVVVLLQEFLNQEQALTDNMVIITEPANHVTNSVQSAQQQLAKQF